LGQEIRGVTLGEPTHTPPHQLAADTLAQTRALLTETCIVEWETRILVPQTRMLVRKTRPREGDMARWLEWMPAVHAYSRPVQMPTVSRALEP
jgi:hypothetical protein